MIESASAGEHLRVVIEQGMAQCRVSMSRPAALRRIPDALLFEGIPATDDGRSLAGFSLRLVRGLARIAGGDLAVSETSLALTVPRA
jgi:hypothetical protein